MKDLYPDTPGHNNTDTSTAAATSIEPHVTRLAELVMELLRLNSGTCWEVECALKMSHQTASARIRELWLKGRVQDSGRRRKTGSGRNAIVWEVAP